MYNVELFNKTARRVEASKTVNTLEEVARTARAYVEALEARGIVTAYGYIYTYCGRFIGQEVNTTAGAYSITTAKT